MELNWHNIWKTVRKHDFLTILSVKRKFRFFDTPGTPGDASIVEWTVFQSIRPLVLYVLYYARTWCSFFVCSFVKSTFTQLISFTCMLSFRSCILLLGLASEVVHLILNRPFKIELLWHSLSLPKFCHVSNVHCNVHMYTAQCSVFIPNLWQKRHYFIICTKQDS